MVEYERVKREIEELEDDINGHGQKGSKTQKLEADYFLTEKM
jgi:hypothetical protein